MIFIDDLVLLHPSREELKKITAELVTIPSAGIPHQPGEIWSHSLSENGVSGLHRRFGLSDTLSSHGEVGQDSPGMLSCSFCKTHHNQVPSPSHRANVGSNSGSVACPPLSQATPTPEERCFQEESVLRCQADPRPGSQTGPSVVATRWNGRPMQPGPPDLTLESDASMLGWGASMLGSATGGLWSSTERNLHISRRQANTREISDIFYFTAIHFCRNDIQPWY